MPEFSLRNRGLACPDSFQLARFHAGLLNSEETAQVLAHLADCPSCARDLRMIAGLDEGEDAVDAGTSKLPAPTPAARRKLARDMSARGRGFSMQCLVAAAVAASVLLWAGWYFYRFNQDVKVRALVAEAYSSRRTTPFRLASGGEARRIAQESGNAERPEALLRALAEIEKAMTLRSGNADLLTAFGEAKLLDKDFEQATGLLERAHRMNPANTATMIDLATAYAERARQFEADRPLRLKALQLLDACVAAEPANPVVRFNRALLLIDMDRPTEAAAELRESLHDERQSSWRAEIAERLDRLAR